MNGIVVLISGRGSNLAAICKSGLASQIKCVISNKADAAGLAIATQYNIPHKVIVNTAYPNREEFDTQLAQVIDSFNPQLVVLAGFMRILTSELVNHYKNRMINIHPSLLPAFTGFNAQKQALDAKVKISGATVHFVTPQLDHVPIIVQGVVKVGDTDTEDDLSSRILELEHVIYPFAIKKILDGNVRIDDMQVITRQDADDAKILGKFQSHIYY